METDKDTSDENKSVDNAAPENNGAKTTGEYDKELREERIEAEKRNAEFRELKSASSPGTQKQPGGIGELLLMLVFLAVVIGGICYGGMRLFRSFSSNDSTQTSSTPSTEENRSQSATETENSAGKQPEEDSSPKGTKDDDNTDPSPRSTTESRQQTNSSQPNNTPSNVAPARASATKLIMKKNPQTGLYGFIDFDTGNVVIPFAFERVGAPANDIADGFFYVTKDGKQGVINKKGDFVIPAVYDTLGMSDFKGTKRLRLIKRDGKIGLLNADTLKEAVECKYEEFGSAALDGVISAKYDGKYGFINTDGKEVVPFECEERKMFGDNIYEMKKNGLLGFVSLKGDVLLPFEYTGVKESYEDGFYFITRKVEDGELKGVINKEAKVVVPVEYAQVENYSRQFFKVKHLGKYGLFDFTGKQILPVEYKEISKTGDEKLIARSNDDLEALFDNEGKELIGLSRGYSRIDSYPSKIDASRVVYKRPEKGDSLCGVVDANYKEIIPCEYRNIQLKETVNLRIVQGAGRIYGIFDATGKMICPLEYDDISLVFGAEYFKVHQKSGYGIMDKTGKMLLPCEYVGIEISIPNKETTFDFAVVSKREPDAKLFSQQYGVINNQWQEVIPCEYEYLRISKGLAYAKKDKLYGVMDMTGKVLIPFEYGQINGFSDDGVSDVYKDGRRFKIDRQGNEIK